MASVKSQANSLSYAVLSEKNWKDLETLFGENGACGGCWCMTPRLSTADYNKNKGPGNKKLLYGLLTSHEPLGIIAYHEKMPIAWCSISPKERLLQMKKSRTMARTNAEKTWSIVCLFIQKKWRRKGISTFVIDSAVAYAFANGAATVEAYPVVPKTREMPDAFAWFGISKSYEKAGFSICEKVSDTKVIMQKQLARKSRE